MSQEIFLSSPPIPLNGNAWRGKSDRSPLNLFFSLLQQVVKNGRPRIGEGTTSPVVDTNQGIVGTTKW